MTKTVAARKMQRESGKVRADRGVATGEYHFRAVRAKANVASSACREPRVKVAHIVRYVKRWYILFPRSGGIFYFRALFKDFKTKTPINQTERTENGSLRKGINKPEFR